MHQVVDEVGSKPQVDLSRYDNSWYCPQRGIIWRLLWHLVNVLIVKNHLNISSGSKIWLLRSFGATIGQGVVIKPGVNVKYPWHLEIGDHTWIGEDVWIDCLVPIRIGSHACVSQGAYLCTGNHDWTDPAFGLMVKPIKIEDGAWIGAKAVILPGVVVANHTVVGAGSVLSQPTQPYTVYAGNPAVPFKKRIIKAQTQVTNHYVPQTDGEAVGVLAEAANYSASHGNGSIKPLYCGGRDEELSNYHNGQGNSHQAK